MRMSYNQRECAIDIKEDPEDIDAYVSDSPCQDQSQGKQQFINTYRTVTDSDIDHEVAFDAAGIDRDYDRAYEEEGIDDECEEE